MIRAAQEFIAHATPLKDAFIAHQLPPDFLEKLASEIDVLTQSISAQSQASSARASAAGDMVRALDEASVALLRLDAIIENMFRDDNAVLTAWKTAREVRKPRERRKATKSQPANSKSETPVAGPASDSSPALVPHPSAVPEQPAVSSPA